MKKYLFFLCLMCFITPAFTQSYWNIKAVHSSGKLLPVKAIDKSGKIYDIKAESEPGNHQFMNVVMLIDGRKNPVKMLVNDGTSAFLPVKGIDERGMIIDIKAIAEDGQKLDIKGVGKNGSVIHIKAIGGSDERFGIKAISPEGILHDIKGIKFDDAPVEGVIRQVEYYSHIKAIPQVVCDDPGARWHIKGIHPEGKIWDIKAFDKDGNVWDVKAISRETDFHLMDVRAIRGDKVIPIKLLSSNDK